MFVLRRAATAGLNATPMVQEAPPETFAQECPVTMNSLGAPLAMLDTVTGKTPLFVTWTAAGVVVAPTVMLPKGGGLTMPNCPSPEGGGPIPEGQAQVLTVPSWHMR